MSHVCYQHIGHQPRFGEIVLWTMDTSGEIHEARATFEKADGAWLDWSHENTFREVKWRVSGRVETGTRTGSIQVSDPDVCLSPSRMHRLLAQLDKRFPRVRWYVFGPTFRGELAASIVG